MNTPPRHAVVALTLALAVTAPLEAQSVSGVPEGKRVVAERVGESIRLDGRLDEAAWRGATFRSDFLLKDPVQFGEPTDRTEVAFLYDGGALYVGARMRSVDPAGVPRDVTRRDQTGNAELLTVSLDPHLDRRTAYSFSVSSGGVRRDYYHERDSEEWWARDFTFDPVWEARVAHDSTGWTAEMRIPFDQLRFNDAPVQTWGLNMNRWVPQRNEDIFWIVVPRDEAGYVSRFGLLTGIEGVEPTRRIEIQPYLAASSRFSPAEAGNPFEDGNRSSARGGADVRMGLGPSLTLSATVNPDFGQVEADPAELNLSAFETFFSERRPFFTEQNQLLQGRTRSYFYSRRIGGRPGNSPDADFAEVPDATTILGAARLTGRLGSGLSLGALTALTQREFARTYDTATAAFGRAEVEPAALFGVLRLQQEVGDGGSTAGLSLSGMRRFFSDGSPLAEVETRQALAGGADWLWRFADGRYEVDGHLGFSWIEGSAAALERVQRRSAHYFQRPDADRVRLDPTRTSLSGLTASLGIEKNAGDWLWELEGQTQSPGFETNDQGRLSRADQIEFSANLQRRETDPGPVFRNWSVGVRANGQWNYDGDRVENRVALWAEGQWANYVETNLTAYYGPRALSDTYTRGGPLMGTGAYWGIEGGARSSFANPNGWRIRGEFTNSESGTRYRDVSGGVFARPSSRLRVSLDPAWSSFVNPRQYVTTVNGGNAATFGTRYVFATVHQTVLSAQVRVDYTVNPDLTLEVYAEPFAASGRYTSYKELPAPGRRDFLVYGTGGTTITPTGTGYLVRDARDGSSFRLADEDFNRFSFRSNVVLRWEWRPGSTLFVVWQQNRSAGCAVGGDPADCPTAAVPGTRVRPGFLADALSVPGANFIAVKISYWLPIH